MKRFCIFSCILGADAEPRELYIHGGFSNHDEMMGCSFYREYTKVTQSHRVDLNLKFFGIFPICENTFVLDLEVNQETAKKLKTLDKWEYFYELVREQVYRDVVNY